jgi:hypothetical protein
VSHPSPIISFFSIMRMISDSSNVRSLTENCKDIAMNPQMIVGVILLAIVSGCGVSQSEYDELKKENERLKVELDEYRFGEERLIAIVEKAYNEGNYQLARQNIEQLASRHSESNKNTEFEKLIVSIEKEELKEKLRKEAEDREKTRLANLNNTGMWTIRYYVDDFGEPTKDGYISNTDLISGTFSNTATQNSELTVRFLIADSTDISIKLFEYAGNNPVKKIHSLDRYTVLVQDRDGTRLTLRALNSGDRLYLPGYSFRKNSRFDEPPAPKLHESLMKGGTLKFRISKDKSQNEYSFTIQNSDWYENAYRKLYE